MNKSYIIGSLFALATFSSQAQDTLFVCNFENGIPETFNRYDRDGNEPSRSMKHYGLENGVAWAAYAESGTNSVAVSGSWYKEVAQSDDWLVTPAVSVTDTRAILSWRACAIDAEHPDGYSVYISDKGCRPEDFIDGPVLTVSAEAATWKDYFLPLDAYAGKDVYIAFVNNSTNCNLLMVDDIVVLTREHTFNFVNLTPEAVTTPGGVTVTGSITSSGFLPVEGYKLELVYGGQTYTIDRSTESIAPDSIVTVAFDVAINVALNTTEDYTLTVSSMEGTDADTIHGSITCFERTVLIEEGTGTWCMWCPRGQYGLQQLHKKRPGEFIDIAVHVSDEMMVTDYAMGLYAPFFSTYGLPSCVMDRNATQVGDPYNGVEEMLDKARGQGTVGRFIELEAFARNNIPIGRSTVRLDYFFVWGSYEFGKAVGEGEYRLSFIVVEDSVTGYAQANAYSGSSSAMGGLDLLPDPIPAGEYYFANVGRARYDSLYDDLLIVGAQTERHQAVSFYYDFCYPENISDITKVKLVGLMIDARTGEVVNAMETKLPYVYGVSIDGTEARIPISLQGTELVASSPIRQVELWSIDGHLLHRAAPDTDRYTLPQVGTIGRPIIIKAISDEEIATFKTVCR